MMGGWLARLKNEKGPDTPTTKPTKPPKGKGVPGFVGFVSPPPAAFPEIGGFDSVAVKSAAQAANDALSPEAAPATDTARWCWPDSPTMNPGEIDTFTSRLARFTEKGLSLGDAERLADKLVQRDREGDDRRLCLECTRLQGAGRWRCGNWKQADVASDGLARDLVLILQRCLGYSKISYD